MRLNLGHTLGHAIEKVTGIDHGYAVAAGIGFICDVSTKTGLMDRSEGEKIKSLLKYFGLPSGINEISGTVDIDGLTRTIAGDKKRNGVSVDFVLLESSGNPVIKNILLNEVENMIRENTAAGSM